MGEQQHGVGAGNFMSCLGSAKKIFKYLEINLTKGIKDLYNEITTY